MRSLALVLPLVLLAACGGAPPPAPEAAPAPTASAAPAAEEASSPAWEVAAKGAEGEAACKAVHDALVAEKACVGSLCAHGAALAKEHARRCPGADASLGADLAERAKKAPSACGAQADEILTSGCKGDATCERTASKWAARCGKSDGSPLVLGLLGREVAKRSALPEYTIDARGCDELRAELQRGISCTRATCAAALKSVQAFRMRCEGDDLADAVTALREAAIEAAAGKPTAATRVRPNPPQLTPADMPVLLSNRWGAAAAVCGEGLADVAAYVAGRRACKQGKVAFVRTAVNDLKDYVVRGGVLDAPDDQTFARRFPSLRVLGEAEARDALAKQVLAAELPKVAALAKEPASVPEAARTLARLAREFAREILRSADVRATFAAVDADLEPALAAIGKAKLTAAKGDLAPEQLAVIAARAPKHPFADLGDEGGTPALEARMIVARIEGDALFPRAMKVYGAALGNLAALAKKNPFSTADAAETKASAVEAAKGCAESIKRADQTERDVIACAFTTNTCDPGKIEALTKSLDEDRNAVVAARHKLDLAIAVLPAGGRAEVEKAAAGCPR